MSSSINLFQQLRDLVPLPSVYVGVVLAVYDDDTSDVQIPGAGTTVFAGNVVSGSVIRARGSSVDVGKRAFVRAGVIETQAPDGDIQDVEVGKTIVVPAPAPPPAPAGYLDWSTAGDHSILVTGDPFDGGGGWASWDGTSYNDSGYTMNNGAPEDVMVTDSGTKKLVFEASFTIPGVVFDGFGFGLWGFSMNMLGNGGSTVRQIALADVFPGGTGVLQWVFTYGTDPGDKIFGPVLASPEGQTIALRVEMHEGALSVKVNTVEIMTGSMPALAAQTWFLCGGVDVGVHSARISVQDV